MTTDHDASMPSNVTSIAKKLSPNDEEEGQSNTAAPEQGAANNGLFGWMKLFSSAPPTKSDTSLREAIEEYIDEPQNPTSDPITAQERLLFTNILNMRDIRVYDIMIPRADIAAIEVGTNKDELLKFLADHQFSRFPVYKENLDNILGSVHLKDVVRTLAHGGKIKLKELLTDIPIVSPSLPILDLLLVMRKTRRHMALVVDEYGGIDGLVTIGDVIETIIGEMDDEHDTDEEPAMIDAPDGSILADGRVDLEKFEQRFGSILSEEEREENDTLGGLAFAIAGRVPARGEVLTHQPTGMIFEIVDADPRKISRIKIRNIPGRGDVL